MTAIPEAVVENRKIQREDRTPTRCSLRKQSATHPGGGETVFPVRPRVLHGCLNHSPHNGKHRRPIRRPTKNPSCVSHALLRLSHVAIGLSPKTVGRMSGLPHRHSFGRESRPFRRAEHRSSRLLTDQGCSPSPHRATTISASSLSRLTGKPFRMDSGLSWLSYSPSGVRRRRDLVR